MPANTPKPKTRGRAKLAPKPPNNNDQPTSKTLTFQPKKKRNADKLPANPLPTPAQATEIVEAALSSQDGVPPIPLNYLNVSVEQMKDVVQRADKYLTEVDDSDHLSVEGGMGKSPQKGLMPTENAKEDDGDDTSASGVQVNIDEGAPGYQREEIFVGEFLKAGRTWAPAFCDTWVRIKQGSFQPVDFFETTRQYRMAVDAVLAESRSQASRAQGNAASWQGKDQDQKNEARPDPTHRKSQNDQTHEEKHKGKECLCKEVHLFRNCPYMTTSARPTGFKEDKQLRAEIRTKIQKSVVLFLTIRKFCNTNLLDGITKDSMKKTKTDQQNQQNQQSQQSPPVELRNENKGCFEIISKR